MTLITARLRYHVHHFDFTINLISNRTASLARLFQKAKAQYTTTAQGAAMEKSQAEDYLTSLLGKTLRVTTTDTRMFLGQFKCTDSVRPSPLLPSLPTPHLLLLLLPTPTQHRQSCTKVRPPTPLTSPPPTGQKHHPLPHLRIPGSPSPSAYALDNTAESGAGHDESLPGACGRTGGVHSADRSRGVREPAEGEGGREG